MKPVGMNQLKRPPDVFLSLSWTFHVFDKHKSDTTNHHHVNKFKLIRGYQRPAGRGGLKPAYKINTQAAQATNFNKPLKYSPKNQEFQVRAEKIKCVLICRPTYIFLNW